MSPTPRRSIKSPKAACAAECHTLEQLPNIGPAMAAELRRLGIHRPAELRGREPLQLYQTLCRVSGKRQDPCVLDTFIAAVAFMRGAAPLPWWHYTAGRCKGRRPRPPGLPGARRTGPRASMN